MQKVSTIISVLALIVSVIVATYVKMHEPVVVDIFTVLSKYKIDAYQAALDRKDLEIASRRIDIISDTMEKILKEYKRPILVRQALVNPASYKDITNEVEAKLKTRLSQNPEFSKK